MAFLGSKGIVAPSGQNQSRSREADLELWLAGLFRRAGWKVVREPGPPDRRVDMLVDSGQKKYAIELKRSSEARRDRLIPLLSQGILEVQAAKRGLPKSAVPVTVVAADRIPEPVAEQLKEFARQHAPDVAVGVMDSEGFCSFQGFGLERFNRDRVAAWPAELPSASRWPVNLFSDLNCWMLKLLLAPRIAEPLLSAPRERYHSAAQLARVAGVSVMSASRLVRQLSHEGFLGDRGGPLELVRLAELLHRWRAAVHKNPREIPARWILRGGGKQFRSAVRSYASRLDAQPSARKPSPRPGIGFPARTCVGLFEAAELLGLGFVRGIVPYLYLERADAEALAELGLSLAEAERNPDLLLRIPENKESVFRPMVRRSGIPVSDVIQVWLDVGDHPVRGRAQAQQIWKKVLEPAMRSAA